MQRFMSKKLFYRRQGWSVLIISVLVNVYSQLTTMKSKYKIEIEACLNRKAYTMTIIMQKLILVI